MDKELFKMENIAIDSKDPELINLFAELREARDLINQNLLLIDKD